MLEALDHDVEQTSHRLGKAQRRLQSFIHENQSQFLSTENLPWCHSAGKPGNLERPARLAEPIPPLFFSPRRLAGELVYLDLDRHFDHPTRRNFVLLRPQGCTEATSVCFKLGGSSLSFCVVISHPIPTFLPITSTRCGIISALEIIQLGLCRSSRFPAITQNEGCLTIVDEVGRRLRAGRRVDASTVPGTWIFALCHDEVHK